MELKKIYKLKNIEFDNIDNNNYIIGGNNDNLIIHISGPSGAGKTTIGKILKEKFDNKIIVKDIDEMLGEFTNDEYSENFDWKYFDSSKYQLFINKFINKQKKPIIFIGPNHMFWHDKKLYYDMHSQYNFYIKIDDMVVIKQKCLRFTNDGIQDMMANKNIINDITKHNKKFLKLMKDMIDGECGISYTKKLNKMWNRDYEKQGYKFMSREKIIKQTSIIVQNFIKLL